MRRGLRWALYAAIALVGVAFLASVAVVRLLAPSTDVVARVVSPNGDLQAVLVEVNGGATTSFGYEVSIVPIGSDRPGLPAATLYGAVRNDQAYGVNLRWVSGSQLNVEFKQARDAKLEQPALTVSGRRVAVALQSGITDPNAPPGGMLYNLQGSK
jgi:hypothetical protein